MSIIVKITQEKDGRWRVSDRAGKRVQVDFAKSINHGTGKCAGYDGENQYPFSAEWHWLNAIRQGHDNFFHGYWDGSEWNLAGRYRSDKTW